MIFIKPPPRGTDAQGSGAFGAPRGKDKNGKPRKHKGFDYRVKPGSMVYSGIEGRVTRIGWPYKKTKENERKGLTDLRLIEIISDQDLIRYMYVDPDDHIFRDALVHKGMLLGTVQKLPYRGITQHVHVDVKQMVNKRRKFVDPEKYFEEYWG